VSGASTLCGGLTRLALQAYDKKNQKSVPWGKIIAGCGERERCGAVAKFGVKLTRVCCVPVVGAVLICVIFYFIGGDVIKTNPVLVTRTPLTSLCGPTLFVLTAPLPLL